MSDMELPPGVADDASCPTEMELRPEVVDVELEPTEMDFRQDVAVDGCYPHHAFANA